MSFYDAVSDSVVISFELRKRESHLVKLKGLGRKASLRVSSEARYTIFRLDGLGKPH